MARPRGDRAPRAAAMLALALLAGGARCATAVEVAASRNTTDPCYSAPSAAACADFQRSDADWASDLEALCAAMPFMVGCSMWRQCQSGEAHAESPFCAPPSLAADICGADKMHGMAGCEAHNLLCANGTAVEQCLDHPGAPNVLTTFSSKAAIDGVCSSHSMDGCQSCPTTGMVFRDCPEVLNILSKLCISMPDMPQCGEFKAFCADAAVAGAFPKVCTQNAADGSSTALPPMKMWFHQSTRDIFLFKEWVPSSTGQYIGMCIGMCALAVFTQFLKAVRLRVEMRWAARMRALCSESCMCPAPPGGAESEHEAGSSASSTIDGGKAEEALPPCCQARAECGGGGGSGSSGLAPVPAVPRSRRVPFWRSSRRGTLTICGVDLITREQAVRNFWRSCFTFVVIFLDYSLMLLVMTFNIGLILAVCGGFAIGALLFGHAGEQAPAVAGRMPPAAKADSTGDLEAVFVEGPGCCSSGTAAAHLASTA